MPPITPGRCFVDGEWSLFRPPESYRGVRRESERSICKLVTSSQALEQIEVDRLTRSLVRTFPPR